MVQVILVSTGLLYLTDLRAVAALQAYVACLLIQGRKWRMAIFYLILLASLSALLPRMQGLAGFPVGLFLFGVTFMMYKITPVMAMVAYCIQTTRTSELMQTLEKLRLPREISIPLVVIFRFLPSAMEEYRAIRDAVRFRGLRTPMVFVYTIAPMLVRTLRIGSELTASAVTRGIDVRGRRTYFRSLQWTANDTVHLLLLVSGFSLLLVINHLSR